MVLRRILGDQLHRLIDGYPYGSFIFLDVAVVRQFPLFLVVEILQLPVGLGQHTRILFVFIRQLVVILDADTNQRQKHNPDEDLK